MYANCPLCGDEIEETEIICFECELDNPRLTPQDYSDIQYAGKLDE